ncbi:trehalose-phosphatase [Sesbania bispinosa]|nr:trehalose-phosphatase [Sesbania bispinosa]
MVPLAMHPSSNPTQPPKDYNIHHMVFHSAIHHHSPQVHKIIVHQFQLPGLKPNLTQPLESNPNP